MEYSLLGKRADIHCPDNHIHPQGGDPDHNLDRHTSDHVYAACGGVVGLFHQP